MRKKYLSALLFGALLFASAGTFTSCKDYDDDINSLQEQINTIASSLNDLKTKVESMGGVKDVTFADGVLTVTTDAGSATYTIPDKVGITKVEFKDGVLYVDGVEAGKAQTVEVKGGILYIDGEAQELNVNFDSNVVAVIDKAAGIYTLTVNNETIELPIAFANVKINLVSEFNGTDGFYFTECGLSGSANAQQKNGIHWARATKDITWNGPKGNITKDMLIVGQITAAEVSVRPINYDLKANEDKLTLVSSTGDVAPVKVVVYQSQDNGPLHNITRSANVNYDNLNHGDYALGIQLNSDLTDREVIESFATTDGNHNVKYALALDGVIVTDYDFIIDTQLKADTQTSCESVLADNFFIGGLDYNQAPLGTHQMSYNSGRIYDMKVEIDPSSQSDAAVYGVKVDTKAGTITAGPDAENRDFKLKVTLIDVNGNTSSKVITVTFRQEEFVQNTELSPITYTVTPLADKSIVIDLGDVFTSLSDEDAIALLSRNNIEWDIEGNDDKFILRSLTSLNGEITGGITYYADAACTQEIQASDFRNGDKVKSIKYAKIPVTTYNSSATLGEHLLSITLERQVGVVPGDPADRTIKKVNVPVDVKLPTWESLFSQSSSVWENGSYVTRIIDVDTSTGVKRAVISMDAYTAVAGKGANADDIKVVYLWANINGNNVAIMGGAQTVNTNLTLTAQASTVTADGKLPATDVTANYEYEIGGVSEFTVKKYGVNVHIKSIFEDATYVWYDGSGAETTGPAVMNGVDNTIKGTGSEDSDKKNGLALRFSSQNIEIGDLAGTTYSKFTVPGFLGGTQDIISVAPSNKYEIQYSWAATSDGVSSINITAQDHVTTPAYENSWIKLTPTSGMISDNGGTITLTFTDYLGVKTQVVIPFVKKNL